ncbi:unnamed protein product [Diplocarpon coronariae]|uniref:Uncharacterized protein n=1 Tax=Diplocarpon coronariae TaxID=2795749 RepID=A0A218Z0J2_9HELO|nr:hypothetical protein JHW43_005929 [Diplocarpon mali]OWP01468.1 hypothetical protein B2J93_700 [Marssonina coronariae]
MIVNYLETHRSRASISPLQALDELQDMLISKQNRTLHASLVLSILAVSATISVATLQLVPLLSESITKTIVPSPRTGTLYLPVASAIAPPTQDGAGSAIDTAGATGGVAPFYACAFAPPVSLGLLWPRLKHG